MALNNERTEVLSSLPSHIMVPKELLQITFDSAVHSMDFGSGFLDDEEVVALRAVAELLGVDPKHATPSNFYEKYECSVRGHDWRQHSHWKTKEPFWACRGCGRNVDEQPEDYKPEEK